MLVNSAHNTHPTSASCTVAARSETPHIDIYVDGSFVNCGTTWGNAGDSATGPQFADDPILMIAFNLVAIGSFEKSPPLPDVDGLDNTQKFDGVIDEVRYWASDPGDGGARTQAQIQQCMNQKLGVQGVCKVDPSILIGYWLFNEGTGTTIADVSGHGFGGTIFRGKSQGAVLLDIPWDGGWVTGKL